MTILQIAMKYADYHRTLERLHFALQVEPDDYGIYLDASIHRFELSFYLAWNLIKFVLEYEGIEVDSPRSSICEAGRQGMIADTKMWLDMQKSGIYLAIPIINHQHWKFTN